MVLSSLLELEDVMELEIRHLSLVVGLVFSSMSFRSILPSSFGVAVEDDSFPELFEFV